MHRILRIGILIGALTFAALPAYADMVVVTSAQSLVKTLDKEAVAALYLGKTSSFPGDGSAQLYDLGNANPAREKFYQATTGKSASQVKSIWSRLVFSGRALPPKEVSSDAAVIKAVAADPAAVGYVDSSAVDASVHVVFKLP